jgi:hypothetical protein
MVATFRLTFKDRALEFISKFLYELSLLLFIVGLGMIISWPFMAKKTYFSGLDSFNKIYSSENAISFGVSEDNFQYSLISTHSPFETIQSFGLEVEQINQTFLAKLRAPKGNGKESIMIISNDVELSLNIIKYLSQQKWLHHDLLFIIENENDNAEEMLNSRIISTGIIRECNCNSLKLGINLKFNHYDFESVVLETVGKDGDLPNLDLVNMMINGAQSLGLKISLYDPSAISIHPIYNTFFHHFKDQLLGEPKNFGKNGFLSKFNVHTVTLTSSVAKNSNSNKFNNRMLIGKLTTSTVRYLNNLIESLHQSYFLYFMMSNYT